MHPIIGLKDAIHLNDNLIALMLIHKIAKINQIVKVLRTSHGPSGDCYKMEHS